MQRWLQGGGFAALAAAWVVPAALAGRVVGSAHGDLWEALWSLWYPAHQAARGLWPWDASGVLNAPDGGLLWGADPVSALLAAPLTPWLGAAGAWGLLVGVYLWIGAWAAARLAVAVTRAEAAGWVAGVVYGASCLLLSNVHNGVSEAVAGGAILPLAAWAWVRLEQAEEAERARWGGAALAAVGLVAAVVANPYTGVCAWAVAVAGIARRWLRREPVRRLGIAVGAALLVAGPYAAAVGAAAVAPHGLVGIKGPREVAMVRRTIGALDPEVLVRPGAFSSPDFTKLSVYGEDYRHCAYLGWVALALAAYGARGAPDRRWLALGLGAAALALGPVWVRGGEPVILAGRLVVPLPYALLEALPGLSSLSLLYRLTQLTQLALAVLAGRGVVALAAQRGWPPMRTAGLAAALVLAEIRLLSPMAGPLATAPLPSTAERDLLRALHDAPPGGVLVAPVMGGGAPLYAQTLHGQPLASTLNFPLNPAAEAVWAALMREPFSWPEVTRAARAHQLRYLLVSPDPRPRPDAYARALARLARFREPWRAEGGLLLYRLED